MSLMPTFSPVVSAFRFDQLAFEKAYTLSGNRSECSIAWKPDGLRFSLAHEDAESIEHYTVSTAWDVGSVSSAGTTTLNTSISSRPRRGLFYSGNGGKAFVGVGGAVAVEYIEEHALSSAYGGTATYTRRLAGPGDDLSAFTMNDNGTKIYAHVLGVFYENTLSTANDLSSAGGWGLPQLDVSSLYDNVGGFTVARNGTQLVLVEYSGTSSLRRFHRYTLTTPGALAGATYVDSFTYNTDVGDGQFGVVYGDGGKKLFSVGDAKLAQWASVG